MATATHPTINITQSNKANTLPPLPNASSKQSLATLVTVPAALELLGECCKKLDGLKKAMPEVEKLIEQLGEVQVQLFNSRVV